MSGAWHQAWLKAPSAQKLDELGREARALIRSKFLGRDRRGQLAGADAGQRSLDRRRIVEARRELVAETVQERFCGAAVRDAKDRLAKGQVLVDLRRDCGLVARAAGLRDQRDVGSVDSFDGVLPARRRDSAISAWISGAT